MIRAHTTAAALDRAILLGTSAPPRSDQPLLLCDMALDQPTAYLFEADRWPDVIGAGQQLIALRQQWPDALPAGSIVLRATPDRLLALLPVTTDPEAADWPRRLQNMAARISPTLTVSIGIVRLSVDQLFHGLYSAPTRVIGIPGMTDHQQRINRYYGVENPSTLPTAERVAARRCFAEALSLVLADRQRAADNRLIFPFVECLPLCVQCAICAMRPAEVSGKRDEEPLCAICATRRQQSDARQPIPTRQALIAVSTPAVERHLLNQPTPAAYQQASAQIDQTWVQAIREAEKRQAHLLWRTDSTAWLICPPNSVLQVTARLCTALGSALPASAGQIAASVAFSDQSGDNARLLSDIAHPDHDSATDGDATIRLVSSDARYRRDSDRLRYSPETLERLAEAAARLNGDLWRDLPVGTLRHLSGLGSLQATALAYEQFRAQLTAEQRQSLDELIRPLERTWGIATARFFQALGDAQLVADQMRLTTQSTADNAR